MFSTLIANFRRVATTMDADVTDISYFQKALLGIRFCFI